MLTDLAQVYQIAPDLNYTVEDGLVTIVQEQNHWIQRLVRKLKFKLPETSSLTLDPYGSFIFQQINGKLTVEEIGELLGEQFEEANNQLYERLITYLNYLSFEKKYVYLVK